MLLSALPASPSTAAQRQARQLIGHWLDITKSPFSSLEVSLSIWVLSPPPPTPFFMALNLLLTEYWGVGCQTPSCPLLQLHTSTRPSRWPVSHSEATPGLCPREGEEGHYSPIPYSCFEHLGPHQASAEASSAWDTQRFPGPSVQNLCTGAGVGELTLTSQPSGQPQVEEAEAG